MLWEGACSPEAAPRAATPWPCDCPSLSQALPSGPQQSRTFSGGLGPEGGRGGSHQGGAHTHVGNRMGKGQVGAQRRFYPPRVFFVVLFLGRGHTSSLWMFPGHGLTHTKAVDPSHNSDNAGSLTCQATRELHLQKVSSGLPESNCKKTKSLL